MTYREDEVVNKDEQIVRIEESLCGTKHKFYVIHDEYLNYWRSTEDIDDDRAWTRDTTLRAQFASRKAAKRELAAIWHYRREKACA